MSSVRLIDNGVYIFGMLLYESIFYESNPDVDIFDEYVDENSKVLEIDGQKVLFMKTS